MLSARFVGSPATTEHAVGTPEFEAILRLLARAVSGDVDGIIVVTRSVNGLAGTIEFSLVQDGAPLVVICAIRAAKMSMSTYTKSTPRYLGRMGKLERHFIAGGETTITASPDGLTFAFNDGLACELTLFVETLTVSGASFEDTEDEGELARWKAADALSVEAA